MSAETVSIATADGAFSAYLAHPAAVRAPAIVVIQEIFGINAFVRETCDKLAAAGYLAIAPDLFWRVEPGIDLTDHTSRVVLMTAGKEPSVSSPVRSALRLSDVKLLTEAQPLELKGEGELERIRVHDLNEDEEYELTADAIVVLE